MRKPRRLWGRTALADGRAGGSSGASKDGGDSRKSRPDVGRPRPPCNRQWQLALSPSGALLPSVRNELPQPQALVAFGLFTLKPPPIMFST